MCGELNRNVIKQHVGYVTIQASMSAMHISSPAPAAAERDPTPAIAASALEPIAPALEPPALPEPAAFPEAAAAPATSPALEPPALPEPAAAPATSPALEPAALPEPAAAPATAPALEPAAPALEPAALPEAPAAPATSPALEPPALPEPAAAPATAPALEPAALPETAVPATAAPVAPTGPAEDHWGDVVFKKTRVEETCVESFLHILTDIIIIIDIYIFMTHDLKNFINTQCELVNIDDSDSLHDHL